MAQHSSHSGPPVITPPQPPPTASPAARLALISGKVTIEGGGPPGEPVAIERLCGAGARLLGYTDFKGEFQFSLTSNPGFQDASENDPRITPLPGPRMTTANQSQRPFDLTGCELRAVLAGFQSSTVLVRVDGNAWNFDAGTIVLTRMNNAPGSTISVTSLNAPPPAMRAYEKAYRAAAQHKLPAAEKELQKAVQLYPQFAAAWTLLGDVHSQENQPALARSDYSHALAADPRFVNPCFKLVLLAIQEKKWDEAVAFAEKAESLDASAYPSLYFYEAAADFNLHRFEAAEENAKKFKELDNNHSHPDIMLLLSLLLERRLDYPGAAQQLREYLAAAPSAPNAEALRAKAKRLEDLSVAQKTPDPK